MRAIRSLTSIFTGICQAFDDWMAAAVKFQFLVAPVEVIGQNGRMTGLKCLKPLLFIVLRLPAGKGSAAICR